MNDCETCEKTKKKLEEMIVKMEKWSPTAPDPIGPLHGAGMSFAYRETAKWFRAEFDIPVRP